MKNQYDVAVGQVKTIESQTIHAEGVEPCVYLVSLEAEGLTDGSAVLNVACYLRYGGRTLRAWNWYTPEAESQAIYRLLTETLASRTVENVMALGLVRAADSREDSGNMDVSDWLRIMREAYRRGVESTLEARDRLEAKVLRLEAEQAEAIKKAAGQMRRGIIKVTKQVVGKDLIDIENDGKVYSCYLGVDPGGRAIAVIPLRPLYEKSLVLRASLGSIWVEVK